MSRYVTHIKRLLETERHLPLLLERIQPPLASPKLGPLLWQLPPTFKRHDERLAAALDAAPHGLRHAVEFRHQHDPLLVERDDRQRRRIDQLGGAVAVAERRVLGAASQAQRDGDDKGQHVQHARLRSRFVRRLARLPQRRKAATHTPVTIVASSGSLERAGPDQHPDGERQVRHVNPDPHVESRVQLDEDGEQDQIRAELREARAGP